jgi:hypothetical protein
MISAYSVVWDPVSAPNGCDEAVRLDNDTVLTGMATPCKVVDMKWVPGSKVVGAEAG